MRRRYSSGRKAPQGISLSKKVTINRNGQKEDTPWQVHGEFYSLNSLEERQNTNF
jgi:hypothetical protein